MADHIITKPELIGASKDAKSLEVFMSGSDIEDVITRLGKVYPTLAKLVRLLMETGGWKAYQTETALKATVPIVSPSVAYAFDTKKLYLWNGSVWVDEGLSALDQAKAYIDSLFFNIVPLNSNFDDIIIIGDHYVRSQQIANSCLNIPEKIAGRLTNRVYRNDTTIYQTYRTTTNNVYERTRLSGVWSAWKSLDQVIGSLNKSLTDLKGASMNSWTPASLQNSTVFDFTNMDKYTPSQIGDISTFSDSKDSILLGVGTTTQYPQFRSTDDSYACLLKTNLRGLTANKAILPVGSFTAVVSIKVLNSLLTPLIFQSATGQAGRVQIYANAEFNGSINALKVGKLQVFIGGASGGQGVGGQAKAADIPNKPFLLKLHKSGDQLSIYVDNELIDTITSPEIYQVNTNLFRDGSTHSDIEVGRFVIVNGAITGLEIDAVEKWVGKPFYDGSQTSDGGYIEHIELVSSRSAGAVIVGNGGAYHESQLLYLENDEHIAVPASVTKVVTAMVLLDIETDFNTIIERTSADSAAGSGANLNVGDKITIFSALRNLMLPSSNVTANIIGRVYGRKILVDEGVTNPTNAQCTARWVQAINAKAVSIGMTDTTFVSPSGLGDNGKTKASDMLRMTSFATTYKDIMAAWSVPIYDMPITDNNGVVRVERIETTVVPLKEGDHNVFGGKTGTLPAYGFNVVEVGIMPDGRYIAMVTLGASSDVNRTVDARKVVGEMELQYNWLARPIRN